MRIKTLAVTALAASLTVASATSAVAQEIPNWIGFAAGNTQFENGHDLAGITSPTSVDKSDNAWKLFLGVPFTKNLALELGYAKLGDQSVTGTFANATASARTTNTAYLIDLLGNIEINQNWSALGRIGLNRWGVNSDITKSGVNQNDGSDGFNFSYGLGMQYNVNPDVGLRLEYQKVNNMGHETTTGTTDARLITFGILYKFKIL